MTPVMAGGAPLFRHDSGTAYVLTGLYTVSGRRLDRMVHAAATAADCGGPAAYRRVSRPRRRRTDGRP